MDGLFSHAQEPAAPVVSEPAALSTHTLLLPMPAEQAAAALVDYLHLWWPAADFSRSGEGAHFWWDAEGLFEEAADGEQHRWGTTSSWDWPRGAEASLEGPEGDQAGLLAVELTEHAEGTLLTLTGTQMSSDPSDSQTSPASEQTIDDPWALGVDSFARFMGLSRS